MNIQNIQNIFSWFDQGLNPIKYITINNKKYFIGTHVAAFLEVETFNIYRNKNVKDIKERLNEKQIYSLIRQKIVKSGTHSVTIIPYSKCIEYMKGYIKRLRNKPKKLNRIYNRFMKVVKPNAPRKFSIQSVSVKSNFNIPKLYIPQKSRKKFETKQISIDQKLRVNLKKNNTRPKLTPEIIAIYGLLRLKYV